MTTKFTTSEILHRVNAFDIMREALESALVAFQLLGSGQRPMHSNAEYCEIVGAALAVAARTPDHPFDRTR